MTHFSSAFTEAALADASDPLASFRDRFGTGLDSLVYLDGNSLGPLPLETIGLMDETVSREWGTGLIRSWNAGWYALPKRLGSMLAPLVGARENEVCFGDSVTINFHKLASSALSMQPGKQRIVTDELNFPSNFYALEGLSRLMGNREIVLLPSPDGIHLPAEAYEEAIDETTAFVTLSHVVFKSGYMQDVERIARAARRYGALILVDLSHSVGSVPIELNTWGVDLAVGCSYKFLNGGPGAPAFFYVRSDLIDQLPPGLSGWFGCADPFAFEEAFKPAAGIERFLVGTPPILSMRAIESGIALLREAGMNRLREKSKRQGELLIQLWERYLKPHAFALGSPRDASLRGSHLTLRHPEAFRISKAMIQPEGDTKAIIPDFRQPDNLRLGIAPLYISYTDIVRAVERIHRIVESKEYEQHNRDQDAVT